MPASDAQGRADLQAAIERRILDRYVESCPPLDALAFTGSREAFGSLERGMRPRLLARAVGRVPVLGRVARAVWRRLGGGGAS